MAGKRNRSNFVRILSALAAISLGGTMASAQTSLERFDRQLEQIRRETRLQVNPAVPVSQRSFVDYGAFITLNYLSIDDPALTNRGLRQYDFTAYAEMSLDSIHDVFVRGRGFYRDFNDGDSFDGDGDGWDGRLERAFYRFNLSKYLAGKSGTQQDNDLSIKLGRDLVVWGNGLTLSQELDAAVINFSSGKIALEVIAGITPLDTVDFDSSRPNFDGHTKRGFYGALLAARVGDHRPYVYALVQRDYNDESSSVDVGGPTIDTDFEYNSEYFGLGSSGALSDRLGYGVEFVLETGDTLSNSFSLDGSGNPTPNAQTRDDILAWALDAQLDYAIPDVHHTRLSGELLLASGDSDRLTTSNTFGGNSPGSNDHAFNSFGLVNTGLAFAPSASNIIVLRGGISTFPAPEINHLRKLQIGADVLVFGKLNSSGPIDESTSDERYLGFETDVFANWQIHSDVTLALRYGAFFPGSAIDADEEIRQFVYAGVTLAF